MSLLLDLVLQVLDGEEQSVFAHGPEIGDLIKHINQLLGTTALSTVVLVIDF